jgi:hypothetical protein
MVINKINNMKRTIVLLALTILTLAAACQGKDKIFTVPVRLQGGVYIGTDPVLYLTWPISGSTAFSAITGKPTTLAGYGITDAASILHTHSLLYKPFDYKPVWNDVLDKPVFSAVATSGSYNDLVDKPEIIELTDALPTLLGIRLPVLTQVQINALVPVKGLLLFNDTDGVLQIFNGTVWKTIVTTN